MPSLNIFIMAIRGWVMFQRIKNPYAQKLTLAIVTVLLLSSHLAFAREDYCLQPGTNAINSAATKAYRQLEKQSNKAFMRALSGVWLTVTVSQATNQVSYLYESFNNIGLYGYTNYVCTQQNTFCSTYVGTGLYAVRAKNAKSFFGVKNVSDDVGRNHACLSLNGTFVNANTWVSGVARHKRVQ